jgi:hypothetical protein
VRRIPRRPIFTTRFLTRRRYGRRNNHRDSCGRRKPAGDRRDRRLRTTVGAAIQPPPSIGFNSSFSFDFDPSNGIDADKIDLTRLLLTSWPRLGFSSQVGVRARRTPLAVTHWTCSDSAGHPGISSHKPSACCPQVASRYSSPEELACAVNRPNGTGGDGSNSHWKADELSGQYLGIMDPTIGDGFRATITSATSRRSTPSAIKSTRLLIHPVSRRQ